MGLLVALNGKSSKEYPVNAEFPRGSFVVLHFSYVLLSWDYYQLFHFFPPSPTLFSTPRLLILENFACIPFYSRLPIY